jgi:hypothetical protein
MELRGKNYLPYKGRINSFIGLLCSFFDSCSEHRLPTLGIHCFVFAHQTPSIKNLARCVVCRYSRSLTPKSILYECFFGFGIFKKTDDVADAQDSGALGRFWGWDKQHSNRPVFPAFFPDGPCRKEQGCSVMLTGYSPTLNQSSVVSSLLFPLSPLSIYKGRTPFSSPRDS